MHNFMKVIIDLLHIASPVPLVRGEVNGICSYPNSKLLPFTDDMMVQAEQI